MDPALRLAEVLNNISTKIREIICAANDKLAEGGVEDFVGKRIGCLAPLIGCYHTALSSAGVSKRSELDGLVKANYRWPSVRDAAEALLEAEEAWSVLLKNIDSQLAEAGSGQCEETTPTALPGCPGPIHVPLTDARTGVSVALQQYLRRGHRALLLVLLRHFA